ncbi:hypothetical protein RHOSPDRAFT_33727 [Rhodotorula sp. JG-1b]|nr:hypothetical protein RHOSPDRAFT_33727 [Rhodotorula sp. JG-1b]
MSSGSFAGAPLSKALILSTVALSVLAATASWQHHFHLSLVPHLTRDHQLYRLIAHHVAYANSSELLIGTLLLWQTCPGLERLFGTRKFASFLVMILAMSTALDLAVLVLAWRISGGRFNRLPSGPFALVLALWYQSHQLVPTLYHFRLFHPVLTFSNRFPAYLLASLLVFSEPPLASLLPSLIGILASLAYSNNFLSTRDYRLPRRLYHLLGRFGASIFGDDARTRARFRRGTAVTPEEALLQSVAASALAGSMLGGGGGAAAGGGGAVPGGAGAGTARGGGFAGGLDASIIRSMGRATRRRDAASTGGAVPPATADAPLPLSPTEAGRTSSAEEGAAGAAVTAAGTESEPPLPPSSRPQSLSRLTGADFLREWQAGLTGAPEGPTAAQINELTSIFPHHTRHAIIAALLQSELDTSRAAEILLGQQT